MSLLQSQFDERVLPDRDRAFGWDVVYLANDQEFIERALSLPAETQSEGDEGASFSSRAREFEIAVTATCFQTLQRPPARGDRIRMALAGSEVEFTLVEVEGDIWTYANSSRTHYTVVGVQD